MHIITEQNALKKISFLSEFVNNPILLSIYFCIVMS